MAEIEVRYGMVAEEYLAQWSSISRDNYERLVALLAEEYARGRREFAEAAAKVVAEWEEEVALFQAFGVQYYLSDIDEGARRACIHHIDQLEAVLKGKEAKEAAK